MPTERYFSKYPAFPEDVPVAQLPLISLTKLISQDKDEGRELFRACNATGFFLLDFRGTADGETFLEDTETMFELNEKFHALDLDEKMRYPIDPPRELMGYKEVGRTKTETGAPDRWESFGISQDDLLGNKAPAHNPALIEKNRVFLASYARKTYSVVELILAQLEKYLHLPLGSLASRQTRDRPSGTCLRVLHYPPHPVNDRRTSLLGHTDIGTMTILFNVTGGLQILTPDCDPSDETGWKWIKPQPGCAIVNMGDAMVEWSGGIIRSNMHRVTFAPGEQANYSRYSVGFFVRPGLQESMKRLTEGDVIPALAEGEEEMEWNAQEWEAQKTMSIISGRDCATSRGGRRIEIAA